MKKRIAIIGAGVSGLTAGRLLRDDYDVKIYEKEQNVGGMIRCERKNGNLFHLCGGHVFNSKNVDVLNWLWGHFDRDREFLKVNRMSEIYFNADLSVAYPIEDHVYMMGDDVTKRFVADTKVMYESQNLSCDNFDDFLKNRFGKTLYDIYFRPYNEKIWQCNLKDVPIQWLVGKLPMPTVYEMIYNNIRRVDEKNFVHSTFYYEKENGSQLIANRLSEGLDIKCGEKIDTIKKSNGEWMINGEKYDRVFFSGNIKDLPRIIKGVELNGYADEIEALKFHGTTTVLCEMDSISGTTWVYLPSTGYDAHRIICTGNLAKSNNRPDIPKGRMSATIEFTGEKTKGEIIENLAKMPYNPKYIAHHYTKYTYPIQDNRTRDMITSLKHEMKRAGLLMGGRFCDWEYYNMDNAMEAVMKSITE